MPSTLRGAREARRTRGRGVGKIPSGRQVPRGLARSTPAPMSTASANARSRPMRNRSASLSPAMNSFERGIAGIATTPSTVATKLAYRHVLGEAEIAVVESRELGRQRRLRKPVHLVQELERLESTRMRPRPRAYAAGLRRQAWKRSPSTTLSTALRSARNAIPTRSSSSAGTPATAARFASSWPVSKRSAV